MEIVMPSSDKSAPAAPSVISAQEVRVGSHAHRIAVPGPASPSPAPVTPPPAAGGPTVEPIRAGDMIVGIEVTCSCGQCIRIAFDPGTIRS